MTSQFRIPTLLGLSVLMIGIAAGVFLVSQNQSIRSKASTSTTPKNITITNLSSTNVSVFWQTDQPTTGFIQAGKTLPFSQIFKDERDQNEPKSHSLHFVTLTNLLPETTYYYNIKSGPNTYPKNTTLTFKTLTNTTKTQNPSLIGQILIDKTKPADEALIILKIPGAENSAAITKLAGNFILPLPSSATATATLDIIGAEKSSQVSLTLPLTNPILPTIILGQNLDLITISPTSSPQNFDFNYDGIINSLDLVSLYKYVGKTPINTEVDFNNDGVVDQKDIDIFNAAQRRIFLTPTEPLKK